MIFKPLFSSSKGNAYLLKSYYTIRESYYPMIIETFGENPFIFLEAGINIKKLKRKYTHSLSSLAACLLSHEHSDHSKGIKDLLKIGIDCYMSKGTARALRIENHHRVKFLKKNKKTIINSVWSVIPFELVHDAEEPLGFMILEKTPSCNYEDILVFIPDTAYVKNRFANFTMIAVECNFVDEILDKNLEDNITHGYVGARVRRNHMSLNTLINMLKANDLSKCRAIYLMHLSSSNSDEESIRKEVEKTTGIPTYICEE